MKNNNEILVISVLMMILTSCSADHVEIRFDSSEEWSGTRIALKDIAPSLPDNWDDYDYVVLEFMITTPQRFNVGFTTESGYNEQRIKSYTPNGWNRFAIPLRFYREPLSFAQDMAATYNQPRNTGYLKLLTGHRGPLRGVDSIGFYMRQPIGDPVLRVRSVSLAKDDPGDLYLGSKAVVDEFGQWNLGDWEDKIHSLEQMEKEWEAEDQLPVNNERFNYSKFGGYLNARIDEGTGFFRTEKIDDRWWFVDPEGYLFLSLGVNLITPGGGGEATRISERRNLYSELPPEGFGYDPQRPDNASYGIWNLYRRYGDEYRDKAIDNIINRMERWGINTMANWSNREVMLRNRKAFKLQLRELWPDGAVMGLANVYEPGFRDKIEVIVISNVEAYRGNPWLIGYFLGNEPTWPGKEDMVCDRIFAEDDDSALKKEMLSYLAGNDTSERRKEFVHRTFRIWLETVDDALRRQSPGHLNLGLRFGSVPNPEVLELCGGIFDVFSFNCYRLYPPVEPMDLVTQVLDLPMIIGEYHFGTVDRGLMTGLYQVKSQKDRGIAYRYYTERAFTYPGLIGTAYFIWSDQSLTGRFDGENYNVGFVDVTDRPYKYMVEAVSETAMRLYEIHSGKIDPFDQIPMSN